MVELAFKGVEEVINSQIIEPKEPDFQREGVAYKGYSKTQTGVGYRLNTQQPLDLNFSYAWAAEFGLDIDRQNGLTKDFYCTDLVLGGFRAGAIALDSVINIKDGDVTRITLLEPTAAARYNLVLHFEVPIKFSKGLPISLDFTTIRAVGDYATGNFYGWEE